MRKLLLCVVSVLVLTQGCLVLEEEPLVVLSPNVDFQANVRGNTLYVTAAFSANPNYITAGNIPALFYYEGTIELYDKQSGDLLVDADFKGQGQSAEIEVSTEPEALENVVIVIYGNTSVYADTKSDGDTTNNQFVTASDFYVTRELSEVMTLDTDPVVLLTPSVIFQTHIRNSELYATATINANPNFLVLGTIPVYFGYDGVLQVYDQVSGALVRSVNISGSGLANAVNTVADTTGRDGLVIIASGMVYAYADVGSDQLTANDKTLNYAEFYQVLTVDLTP